MPSTTGGGLGRWEFLVTRDPQELGAQVADLLTAMRQALHSKVEQLLGRAEREVERLRALGWTQRDFAQALVQFLKGDGEVL